MRKRPSITLLTVLLAMVFAAGIGVYSSYIGMKIYQESSDHLLESFSQISKTFTLFVQRNWTVLSQWDDLMSNAPDDENIDSIWPDVQDSKASWHYSDFYLFNESTQYLTADGRKGSADSLSGVFQEMYSEGGPIVSTYTASYGVPKIVFAMPLSRNMTLDGVTYTGLAVSYDTDMVDDLVDGSMYGGQSDCYIVRTNGDIVLALEPQTELCEGMTNLYDIDAHADWIYGTMDDIKDCVQLGRRGSAQFLCQGGRNYLVAIPTAFPDWTLVGIIRADEVDGAMRSVQQSTIIALGALCIFAVIIVVLALGMESQLRLRREEEERLSLEREKMQSDRLLQSMSRIVDRYSIINLDTDRYRYRELRNSEPLYPASGRYSDMVETISRRYVALTETENAKLSRLITPEYLRSVLRKPDDNLKIEYCSRTENAYMVLTVIPVEWHADGTVYEVMQVVQDIGQKIELENMANTDSMTGLFNERYFSRVLNICEEKKLPFVLYYLDLDRFKPINDTYGHLMGDRLLKEIAARLLRCIRRNTVSGRLRLVPDVLIALLCVNALAQGAAYRLFGVPFIDMLPLTHLLLTAGVAAMLTVLFRSYREKPAPQLRLRMAAFAALGAFGVAALVLYWLLHIYWYDAVYQFGVLLFIILLLHGLISQAAEDMRFHMEHRISHEMQREDRMTGLPNRRAFEEYMERVRTGEAGCLDAVLTYIRLEGLNERNDRFGLQAGDEAVIAAARCVSDFCRECEDEGESVLCFRTGGNEFALIRPEPHIDSGQLHRQFRAVVARYNRTCAPRARITMTFGFSRLCDEDGKSRSISAWKAEADAHLKRNEARLGGDAE